jgi:hypothetical protein
MLRMLGKGLLARSLAYAVFGLGFWLLFQGFLRPNIPLGILGGLMILVGMYLIVGARRGSNLPASLTPEDEQKEELIDSVHDPIDRSR